MTVWFCQTAEKSLQNESKQKRYELIPQSNNLEQREDPLIDRYRSE